TGTSGSTTKPCGALGVCQATAVGSVYKGMDNPNSFAIGLTVDFPHPTVAQSGRAVVSWIPAKKTRRPRRNSIDTDYVAARRRGFPVSRAKAGVVPVIGRPRLPRPARAGHSPSIDRVSNEGSKLFRARSRGEREKP